MHQFKSYIDPFMFCLDGNQCKHCKIIVAQKSSEIKMINFLRLLFLMTYGTTNKIEFYSKMNSDASFPLAIHFYLE